MLNRVKKTVFFQNINRQMYEEVNVKEEKKNKLKKKPHEFIDFSQ